MHPLAKMLIIVGAVCIAAGLIWQFGGRFLHLGRLPGDIVVEKNGFRVYFPIVTCVLISLVASLLMYVFRLFR